MCEDKDTWQILPGYRARLFLDAAFIFKKTAYFLLHNLHLLSKTYTCEDSAVNALKT